MTKISIATPDALHVDIPRIEGAWNEAIHTETQAEDQVVLDLSSASYIDQESLLYLVGLIDRRNDLGWETQLVLPTSSNTLDFLRAWNFPEAVAAVLGRRFDTILDEQSAKTLSSLVHEPPRYVEALPTPYGGRESVLPTSFFALTPIVLNSSASSAASIVKSKWLNDHVVGVLDQYLAGYGDRVATHVLHEGVLNAASHPNAVVAYTSSQLLARKRPSDPAATARELVVCIWDDGTSFVETLLDTYERVGTIHSPAFGLVDETFALTLVDRPAGKPSRHVLSTRADIDVQSKPHLMLSAFFLGVTSLPDFIRTDPSELEDLSRVKSEWLPRSASSYGGLGLHLIRKTVLDQFGGSLTYVSGSFRLTLRGDGPNAYTARVTRLRASDPHLKGNLLVARMGLSATPSGHE